MTSATGYEAIPDAYDLASMRATINEYVPIIARPAVLALIAVAEAAQFLPEWVEGGFECPITACQFPHYNGDRMGHAPGCPLPPLLEALAPFLEVPA